MRLAVFTLVMSVAVATGTGAILPRPATTDAGAEITAYLGQTRIAPVDVSRHFCHDLGHPIIECFATGAGLEAAVLTRSRARQHVSDDRESGGLRLAYVKVFEHADFGGTYAYLSASYPDLRVIGWSDRVSSYAGLDQGNGTFYEHIADTGLGDPFCCDESLPNLASHHNDRFSSLRVTAMASGALRHARPRTAGIIPTGADTFEARCLTS